MKSDHYIQNPQTMEDFVSNVEFQLQNVKGWMSADVPGNVWSKADCLLRDAESLVVKCQAEKKAARSAGVGVLPLKEWRLERGTATITEQTVAEAGACKRMVAASDALKSVDKTLSEVSHASQFLRNELTAARGAWLAIVEKGVGK